MPAAEAEQTTEAPASEIPAGAAYSVALPPGASGQPQFEGPLDLLLHLCQKHELNILDIPIGFVTEKYLEYLAVMQIMSLDIASEYLVMAATLAHIKSKMLLPAPPPGQEDEHAEEEEDPRESLIRRLLEYQKYKQAGEELQSRGVAGRDVFMRGMPVEEAVHTGLPPLAQVPLFSLVEAFQSVLSKSKIKISHDIVHERITLTDRINELVDVLRVKKRVVFEELFTGLETRFDLVITFLAVLEMTKLRMTRLHQSEPMSPIYVEFTAQLEETSETTDAIDAVNAIDAKHGDEEKEAELGTNVADTEPPPELGTNVSDTEPPPDMAPPIEGDEPIAHEEEDVHAPPSLETIPSPPLSEDEGEDPT